MLPGIVFVDRDGTIIEDGACADPLKVKLMPTAKDGIAMLKAAGLPICVVTNQAGIGRNEYSTETYALVNAIMWYLLDEAVPDTILYCPHVPDDHCSCRKPRPGMLYRIMAKNRYSPERSYMVGNEPKDIVAGKAAGLFSIHVHTDVGQGREYWEDTDIPFEPDVAVETLADAARNILTREQAWLERN